MTLYIFLPGYSSHNKEEAYNISENLRELNKEVYIHEWRHWKDDSLNWEPTKEKETILNKVKSISPDKIIIIGKSIGTFITCKLLEDLKDKVIGLILMGIPLKDINQNDYKVYTEQLKMVSCPTYVIQNNNDPHSDLKCVQNILEGVKYNLIVKEANDHRYNYPEEILPLIQILDKD